MTRIEKARQIVDNHEAGMIDGFWVDVQTANMLVTVWEALTEANREKFETVSFTGLVAVGWKNVKAVTT